MQRVDELLQDTAIAETISEESFTPVDGYEKKSYTDAQIIRISNKSIGSLQDQITVEGESLSQYIVFEHERYADGIDLKEKLLQIHYERADGVGDNSPAVNVEASDEHIRFGWIVPQKATQVEGILRVMPFIFGKTPDSETYILKDLFAQYTVHEGLELAGGIEEPFQDEWYIQFLDNIENINTSAGETLEAAKQAKQSETNAKNSEGRAESSATQAATSASEAKASETSAQQSKESAASSATAASASETSAQKSAETATTKASEASTSAAAAKASEASAQQSKESAATSETQAENWAKQAESYAHGEVGVRENEETDNGKYYLEQTRLYANSVTGALKPMGSITFLELATAESEPGMLYDITDNFVSDERFTDGGGVYYGEGTEVYRTATGLWNATPGAGVAGVKGEAESAYRKGLVELTPDNIGLGKVENKSGADILGEMQKDDVTKALGYEPPVNDTQGVNLFGFNKGVVISMGEGIFDKNINGVQITKTASGSPSTGAGGLFRVQNLGFEGIPGWYTVSGEIYATEDVEIAIEICDTKGKIFNVTTEAQKFVVQCDITDKINSETLAAFKPGFVDFEGTVDGGLIVYVKNLKVERGTVTDPQWTPAPEDMPTHGTIEQAILGENLILGSEDAHFNAYGEATIDFSTVSVEEWGANDAIQASGRSGTSTIFATMYYSIYPYWIQNQKYTGSIYLKNNGKTNISIALNSLAGAAIKPGESKKIIINATGNKNYVAQFVLSTPLAGDAFDFIYWHPKIEEGDIKDPIYTPATIDRMVDATRKSPAVAREMLNYIFPRNAGAHNSVFRGNNLGTSVTEAQYAAIANGSFDDLFVGDYWTINSTVYRIAGLDIFLHYGDTELTRHHAVIVPDRNMYSAKMNDTDVTTGAYWNSQMKTTNLANALTTVKTAFGSTHIISHRTLFATATSGDNPSNWAWQSTEIDLMTERQVYGSPAWGQAQHNGYDANSQYSRFPLFTLAPEYICVGRAWYWLQDVRSSASFCLVDARGGATSGSASASGGVRPAFLIG